MKKTISLFGALLLMSFGWAGAFLLGNSPYLNPNYWLIPAVTIGAGIGLCLRFVSGRKTALLLAITAATGLATLNSFFPDNRVSLSSVQGLFSAANTATELRQVQIDPHFRSPPFDQSFNLISPVSLDVSIYARLPAAVDEFCFSPDGTLYASLSTLGAVYRQKRSAGTAVPETELFIHGLDNPTGLLCDQMQLLVAESSKLKSYPYAGGTAKLLIDDLPDDGGQIGHRLQQIPEGLLYTIGSRCDACDEKNRLRATVQLLDRKGLTKEYARGLRDIGGLTFNPLSNRLWASERSRIYPAPGAADELNQILPGIDYGWPNCDGEADRLTLKKRCEDIKSADLLLRKRANPAGLMSTHQLKYPSAYRSSLLMVLQGDSDNRILPAVVRIPLVEGAASSPVAFLGGWDGVTTLPSAIHGGPEGAVYISDGLNGAIYRAVWQEGS